MPRLTFTPGEILTAANLNVVSDQSVMVFDDAAARTTAIPSPVEGMVTYLKDTDAVEKFDGSAFVNVNTDSGKILQVKQTVKTDTFTTSSGTYTDITGMSVSITPQATSSKILVTAYFALSNATAFVGSYVQIVRDSTILFVGDSAGSRVRATSGDRFRETDVMGMASPVFLDSPNTTSAVTYKLQGRRGSSGTFTFGRSGADADNAAHGRLPSSITVMEVAG